MLFIVKAVTVAWDSSAEAIRIKNSQYDVARYLPVDLERLGGMSGKSWRRRSA